MRIEQEARPDSTVVDSDRELSTEGKQEALEDSFFSEPPKTEPVDTFWDLDAESDDEDGVERVRNSRRAMIVTFVILGVAVVGIGSYTVYAKVLMPTPVAMGAVTSLPELPQPIYSDNQENRARAQSNTAKGQPERAKSTEQTTQNTEPPPAVEQAPTLPIETGALAQEQDPAETEQPSATESQTEPTVDKNSTAATTEPAPQDTQTAKPIEDINIDKKDKVLAQAPSARPASEAVSLPIQTASNALKQKVERKSAAVRPASSAKPPSDYKAIVKRANMLYRSRKTRGQAVAEYQRALTLNPNGDEALRKLSYYYLNQGRSNDAEQFAIRAVRANPYNAQSWFLLGAARDARNDRQGAQQAYRGCAQGKGAYATQCQALFQ
jgi:tetratricopeptide (TPR) repeat protein